MFYCLLNITRALINTFKWKRFKIHDMNYSNFYVKPWSYTPRTVGGGIQGYFLNLSVKKVRLLIATNGGPDAVLLAWMRGPTGYESPAEAFETSFFGREETGEAKDGSRRLLFHHRLKLVSDIYFSDHLDTPFRPLNGFSEVESGNGILMLHVYKLRGCWREVEGLF